MDVGYRLPESNPPRSTLELNAIGPEGIWGSHEYAPGVEAECLMAVSDAKEEEEEQSLMRIAWSLPQNGARGLGKDERG